MLRMIVVGVSSLVAVSMLLGTAIAASGLPTGKRQHKPFTMTKPTDKSGGTASPKINSTNPKKR